MIVPVMAISNLVLTQQIYSEETNGAHAHYREPVPLIRWFVSKALHSFIRILTQTARENYPVRRTFYDVNHVYRMGLSGFFFYPKQGRGYKPCMTSLWAISSPRENLTLATEKFYL